MDQSPPNAAGSTACPADFPPGAADPTLERFWAIVRRLPRYLTLGVNLAGDGRLPTGLRVTVVSAGAYAVSPIDLVPGIIPVAGQLDDVAVILLTLRRAIRACPPAIAAEQLERAGLQPADFDRDLATCRATALWLARQGVKLGGRLALGAGRRLRAAFSPRP